MRTSRIAGSSWGFLCSVLLASPLLAAGPTFTVTTPGDAADAQIDGACETAVGNHTCTLRAAVMEANATTGATIVIPAGTYSLTVKPSGFDDASTGDLNITSAMTIQGAGAGKTFLDATNLGDRAFTVFVSGTLTISGLTIQNATSVAVGGNIAYGGAFWVRTFGTLSFSDGRITKCKAVDPTEAFGGAIAMEGLSTATLTRVVIDSCESHASPYCAGGAIQNDGGMLTLDHCTIFGCSSDGPGGAISLGLNSPKTRIVASSLYSNLSLSDGGAIDSGTNGNCVIVNSTLYGNLAYGNGGGVYSNGVLGVYSSTITANHCDFDQNHAGAGGGIFCDTGGSCSFQNTILAKNFDTSSGVVVPGDCSGTLSSNGNNIVYSLFYLCTVTPAATYTDPMLPVLGNAGGPTVTAPPNAGSPAIDAGNPGGCTDDLAVVLTTDQRGVKRPIGAHCDIGAVEVEPKGDVNGDGHVDVLDVFYLINYLFAGGPGPAGRADLNGDLAVDILDVFHLINFLFANGPA